MAVMEHRFIQSNGFNVCIDCGICKDEKIIVDPDFRYYNQNNSTFKNESKKQNEILNPMYKSTLIDYKSSINIQKWRKLNKISSNCSSTWIIRKNKKIKLQLSKFNFPNHVKQEILLNANKFWNISDVKGQSVNELFCSITILTLKKHSIPFLRIEILHNFGLKKINPKVYEKAFQVLGFEYKQSKISDLFIYHCNKLFEFNPLQNKYYRFCKWVEKNSIFISGKSPVGIVGAIIYHYSIQTKKIPQNTISKHLNITAITLRSSLNQLKPYLEKLVKK